MVPGFCDPVTWIYLRIRRRAPRSVRSFVLENCLAVPKFESLTLSEQPIRMKQKVGCYEVLLLIVGMLMVNYIFLPWMLYFFGPAQKLRRQFPSPFPQISKQRQVKPQLST